MAKNILTLIKESRAVRSFDSRKVSDKALRMIVEAGVWGPSVFGVQPWYFVIIKKRDYIKKIAKIMQRGSKELRGGIKKLLQLNSNVIKDSKVLIAIYSNNRIKKNMARYGITYMKKGMTAEILSCGAAIQNMFLLLNSLNLGGVWLDSPTIFSTQINKLLEEKKELLSVLAIGHPVHPTMRSSRSFEQIVKFL